MKKSRIFYSEKYKEIEQRIMDQLNSKPDFLSGATVHSTRAVGDAIQEMLSEDFQALLGDLCKDYSSGFARRAMADLAFKDLDDFYYVVDVKTHRLETKFNMPNLTSVERLARFYEDDTNYFVILIAAYMIEGVKVKVQKVHFVPIEFLAWDCLTVGALGWGQIQIANSNYIHIEEDYSRKRWMIELCDVMLEFYPKEIAKIGKRIDYFKKIKQYWENKPEI